MAKYYITYSEYYPIYEPAEGGYYYSGKQICYAETAQTFRKARLKFRKWVKESDINSYDRMWICNNPNFLSAVAKTRYIGEGWIIEVTRKPVKERGYEPYC